MCIRSMLAGSCNSRANNQVYVYLCAMDDDGDDDDDDDDDDDGDSW